VFVIPFHWADVGGIAQFFTFAFPVLERGFAAKLVTKRSEI